MPMRRKYDERDREDAPGGDHVAPPVSRPMRPAEALAFLQRSAGNAAVGRMLARAEVEDPFAVEQEADPAATPAIAPHGPGEDADTPALLAEAAAGDGGADAFPDREPELTAAPDKTAPESEKQPAATAGPDPAIVAWLARRPKTNPDHAQWLLDAGEHGFAKYGWGTSKAQLETLAAGGTYSMAGGREIGGTVDGSAKAELLTMLETAHAVIAGRAGRWLKDHRKPKQPLELLWLARNWPGPIADAHSKGAALDAAGGIPFGTPAAGPAVAQILRDLPKDTSYYIGLPWQVPFFHFSDSLLHHTNKAEKAAEAAGGDPADVTVPGLVEWETGHFTATWNKATRKWVRKPVSTLAGGKIRDAEVRKLLGGFDGKKFMALPDRKDHIHIQRM